MPVDRKFRLSLTLVVIAILMAVLLPALEREAMRAEQAGFRMVVGQLESVLLVKTAEMVAKDRLGDLKNFVNHNPMNWMKPPPINYIETDSQSDASRMRCHEAEPGYWFFDPVQALLVYKPNYAEGFGTQTTGDCVVFRLALAYLDRNGNGVFDETRDRISGLTLKRLDSGLSDR